MHSIPKALEKTGFHASDCEGPWSESERPPRSKKIMLSKSHARDLRNRTWFVLPIAMLYAVGDLNE
jgi:hypothetical protein